MALRQEELDRYLPVLEQGKWFHGLSQSLKQSLLDMAVLRRYDPGEVLFARGDARTGLYAVVDGTFRIAGLNNQGKEAILSFIEAPNWIGEIAVFDGESRTHDAFSVGSSAVLHCSQSDLDKLLAANPEYWRDFGLLIAHKLRLTFRLVEDLALLPAPVRLTRRLILMAEGYGEVEGEAKKTISVPQEQLGAMLSISRQTTNQILKDLADKALIKIAYGEIEILDMDGLRAESGEDLG